MALNQKELNQLDGILLRRLDEQRSAIALDTKSLLQEELKTIKEKLDRLIKTESEDVQAAYSDIEDLKDRVSKLEQVLAQLK